jgi:tetratricopeptide (TPR) repeat protein
MYWDVRGYFQESLQWCERALAASDAENSARVQTLFGAGGATVRLGDLERMITLCDRTLALARNIGDTRNIAEAALGLGFVSLYLGNTERADTKLDEALQLFNALGDKDDIGRAHGPFAQRALMQGDYARAAELYGKSLELFREVGDVREIAGALNNLANVERVRGNLSRARAYAQEGLEIYSALADKHGIVTSQRELGRIADAQGDLVYAQQALEASMTSFEEMGDKGCLLESELAYVELLQHAHQYAQTAELAQRVIQDAETLGWAPGIPAAKNILARVALTQGEVERAQDFLKNALADDQPALDAPTTIALLETAALFANARAKFLPATKLFAAAHAQREQLGVPRAPIECADANALLTDLRVASGENFLLQWEQGRALTLAEARTFALDL